jgi:F-type H+-transporting ATPase subunit epsilon
MHVDVVSAEAQIYSGEAEFLVAPAEMGEIGVYPRHVPLLTRIKPGSLRIRVPGQAKEVLVVVSGGGDTRQSRPFQREPRGTRLRRNRSALRR